MTQQFELDFEGGLSSRHSSLLACLDDCISRSPHQKKVIASELDLSPSALSRRLTPQPKGSSEPRFSVELFEEYIEKYEDLTPIYYLVEKFCQKPEDKKRQAISQLASMMPMLEKLIKDAA
jgi:hypothetical protein